MINIEMFERTENNDLCINMTVPRAHIISAASSQNSRNIARLIDTKQFFGMLRDAVHMKLGLDYEREAICKPMGGEK